MQSKQSNRVTIGILLVLLVAVGGASKAFDQAQTPPPQTAPPAPPVKPPEAATEDEEKEEPVDESEGQGEGKSTERFVPSQRTSADNSATFPVDI